MILNERRREIMERFKFNTFKGLEGLYGVASGLALAAAAVAPAFAITPVLDHFKCYSVRAPSNLRSPVVALRDQYSSTSAAVGRPFMLCAPVDKNGEGVNDPTAHLTCYQIDESPPFLGTSVPTKNQFGEETLSVTGRLGGRQLCVPSEKDGVPSKLKVDHFKCYQAQTKAGTPPFVPVQVSLVDQFMEGTATVRSPTKWCNPVDKNEEGILNPTKHLECYDIRNPDVPPLNRKVSVTNQFGRTNLIVQNPLALCVPSLDRTCEPGQTFCPDGCTDTNADPSNCGTCGVVCSTGQACASGTCTTNPNPECMGQTCETFTPCNANACSGNGVCGSTAEGGGLCIDGSTLCSSLATCTTSADCPSGVICFVNSCCVVGVCVPPADFCSAAQ
jgi:hypothetical protein